MVIEKTSQLISILEVSLVGSGKAISPTSIFLVVSAGVRKKTAQSIEILEIPLAGSEKAAWSIFFF